MRVLRPSIVLALSVVILAAGVAVFVRTDLQFRGSVLPVRVVAHAWWWEFDYPTLGIKGSDALYLPSDRWVRLELRSADVLHSFWIEGMERAIDLPPGKTEHLDLRLKSPGKLDGNCDAGCGCGTVCMRFRVLASAPNDFDRWAVQQKNAPHPLTLAHNLVAPACELDKSIDHHSAPNHRASSTLQ